MEPEVSDLPQPFSRVSTVLPHTLIEVDSRETTARTLHLDNAHTKSFASESATGVDVASLREPSTMPEGWPEIPCLHDRRSCECNVTILSPCVTKACDHLQRLLNAINCWLLKHTDVAQRVDLAAGLDKQKGALEQSNLLDSFMQRFSAVKTPELFAGLPSTTIPELRTLGSDVVVAEVVKLLARIQSDLDETGKKIEDEHRRVGEMERKLEEMNEHKLQQLPELVQQEHEQCLNDINELSWHLSYKLRLESRWQQKLDLATDLTKQLSDELRRMKDNIPYVEDKLSTESFNIKDIDKLQEEMSLQLRMTERKLEQINQKNDDGHRRASDEREMMSREMASTQNALRLVTEELELAEKQYREFCDGIQQATEKLKSNDEQRKILESQLKKASEEEHKRRQRVISLKDRIDATNAENTKIKAAVKTAAKDYDAAKFKFESTKKQLEAELAAKELEARKLNGVVEEATLDLDEMIHRLLDVNRRTEWCGQQVTRLNAEIESVEQEVRIVLEEVGIAQGLLTEAQRKLTSEEKKAKEVEALLYEAIQRLKEQIDEEIHARTVLKSRISTDTADFATAKEAFKKKEETSMKLLAEIEKAVAVVETKAKALRATFAEKDEILKNLTSVLDDLKAKYQAMESSLQGRIDVLTPQHEEAKKRNVKLAKDIDYLFWQFELLGKKLFDLRTSITTLTKNMRLQDRLIVKLELQLSELQARLQSKQRFQDATRNSLNAVLSRIKEENNNHAAIIESRSDISSQQRKKLVQEIDHNFQLASQYRKLHNSFLIMKDQVEDLIDEKTRLENTIKDSKELELLQNRTHEYLQMYYRYRLQLSEGKVDHVARTTSESGERIEELQRLLGTTMLKWDEFLNKELRPQLSRRANANAPVNAKK